MLPGRTTALAVAKVIQVPPTQMSLLDTFIDTANELVTQVCAVVFPGVTQTFDQAGLPAYTPTKGGYTYTDYRLEMIERWLAAHFYAVFSSQSQQDMADNIQSIYQGRTALGLNGTWWGQQAMRLDTMGALAVMENGQEQSAKRPPALLAGIQIGVFHAGGKSRCCHHRRHGE